MKFKFFVSVSLISILIVLWVLPTASKPRPLSPFDTAPLFELKPHAPDIIVPDKEASFSANLMVGIEQTIFRKTFTHEEVLRYDQETYNQAYQALSRTKPYLFPRSIGIALGTHARRNQCELRLQLEPQRISNPLPCEDLPDNQYAFFEFDEPIPPGKYRATLLTTAKDSSHGVSPYYKISETTGERWFSYPMARNTTSLYHALQTWLPEHRTQAALYLVGLIIIGMCVYLATGAPYWIAALSTAVLLSAAAITPPLSGYDETAHITQLQIAATHSWSDIRKGSFTENREFYRNTYELMYNTDFFRHHNVVQRYSTSDCPHQILNSCGISKKNLMYYSVMTSILPKSWIAESTEPHLYAALGIVINYAWVFLLLAATLFVAGPLAAKLFLLICILLGGIFSQWHSVTTDFPNLVIALFGAILVSFQFRPDNTRRSTVGLILYTALALFMLPFEDSSFLFFVPLAYFGLIRLIHSKLFRSLTGNNRGPRLLRTLAGSILSVGLLALTFILLTKFDPFITKPLLNQLKQIKYEAFLLDNISRLNIKTFVDVTTHYLKSLIGTYTWGHDYLSTPMYAAGGGVFLIATLLGLRQLPEATLSERLQRFVFLLFVSIALLIIVAIGYQSYTNQGIFVDSFAKVRVSAPLLTIILAPFVHYTVSLFEDKDLATLFMRGASVWFLFLVGYAFPYFYFLGVF